MEKNFRLTIELKPEEYEALEKACANLDLSLEDFLLSSAFKRLEQLEDEWLEAKARETLADIQSGKEKTLSWEEAKKRFRT